MTIKELIAKLETFNPNLEVAVYNADASEWEKLECIEITHSSYNRDFPDGTEIVTVIGV